MKDFNSFKELVGRNATEMAQEIKQQVRESAKDGDDVWFQMQVQATLNLLEAYHGWMQKDS